MRAAVGRFVVCVALATLLIAVPPAGALRGSRCAAKGARGLTCTTLTVPLDRSGAYGGTLRLPVAYRRPQRGSRRWVLALAGGPGQGTVASAGAFRAALEPLLSAGAGFVTFDQRGTGANALRCPALQRLGAVDAIPQRAVADCARSLGPSRDDYATADTVADIDGLRRLLGAARLTVMGVSYGTFVAQRYARTFPKRVSGLVLDSVVGPDGIDNLQLDMYSRLPRIVADWCRPVACPAGTRRSWAAITALARRLQTGPITASLPGGRRARIADEGELARLIGAADVNPPLQALLPGALAAAAAGRPAALVRLRAIANGAPEPAAEFSGGLNVATICADVPEPYAESDDLATRMTKAQAAAAAAPPESFAPFSARMLFDASVAHDCAVWPPSSRPAAVPPGPLPAVPTLLLAGQIDQRTPVETARAVRALIPGSTLVVVGGTGHDTIDGDTSGCVARALRNFAAAKPVGRPCAGADNRMRVAPELPATVARAPRAAGVAARDARAVGAIAATLRDLELHALAGLYAGFDRATGRGLFGGKYALSEREGLTARGYAVIAGVSVSTPRSGFPNIVGRVGGQSVRLTVTDAGTLIGTISGRPFRAPAGVLAQAATARAVWR